MTGEGEEVVTQPHLPQLPGTIRLQHLREPNEGRRLPSLPADLQAIINTDTFANSEQPNFRSRALPHDSPSTTTMLPLKSDRGNLVNSASPHQQQYPAAISPLQQAGLGSPLAHLEHVWPHPIQNSPTIMPQTATESAKRWHGIIDIDMKSGSRRAAEKRRVNSSTSKRFRECKKAKVEAKMEEMQETIERLTKECDNLRHLCRRLEKSRGSRGVDGC
ncbi:hypothetical protein ACJ73_07919, partial [Blastomyces percursus]